MATQEPTDAKRLERTRKASNSEMGMCVDGMLSSIG
jgi:hypothetical protein